MARGEIENGMGEGVQEKAQCSQQVPWENKVVDRESHQQKTAELFGKGRVGGGERVLVSRVGHFEPRCQTNGVGADGAEKRPFNRVRARRYL